MESHKNARIAITRLFHCTNICRPRVQTASSGPSKCAALCSNIFLGTRQMLMHEKTCYPYNGQSVSLDENQYRAVTTDLAEFVNQICRIHLTVVNQVLSKMSLFSYQFPYVCCRSSRSIIILAKNSCRLSLSKAVSTRSTGNNNSTMIRLKTVILCRQPIYAVPAWSVGILVLPPC